jgi:hypothetical protein
MANLETISMENSQPVIIKLFKLLDEQKKKNKTRAALLDRINELSPYMGIPEGFEKFLLELYVLNFREDGDYSKVTKENYVDPRKGQGKTTTNTKANQYTIAQLPFKGSNLRAYWNKDVNGKEQYIVESYGWYPIYIFKEGNWYQVVDSYSSSTGKQINNANPIEWNEDLNQYMNILSSYDMGLLRGGVSPEEIRRGKLERLKKKENELVSARKNFVSTYGDWEIPGIPKTKVKYKISKIDIVDNKAIITVDIYDVVKREGQKSIPTPQNYLKGELTGITKEHIENAVENKLKYQFKEFVGKRFGYSNKLRDIHDIKFFFNHLKEKE